VKDDTPFILECPGCRTRYEIPVSIPEGGRKVRCANCSHIWVAQPEDTFRMGEEPAPFAQPEAEEIVFRSGDEEPGPGADTAPEDDFGDVAINEEQASGEFAAADAMPQERDSVASDPQAFAAAVAEAEARAEATGDFMPAEQEVEFSSDDTAEDDSAGKVIDAEFVDADPVADDQGDHPAEDAAGDQAAARTDEVAAFYDEPGEDDGSQVAAPSEPIVTRKPRRRKKGLRTGLAAGWAILLLAVGAMAYFAVTQRVEIVRLMPGSAPLFEAVGLPVNIRGLDFRDVAYSWETDGGQVVLEVHGDIVNLTSQPLEVPSLILGLRDEAGTEVYQWEEDVMNTPLGAGDSATFAVRIPTPPKSIKSVQVRFARAQ